MLIIYQINNNINTIYLSINKTLQYLLENQNRNKSNSLKTRCLKYKLTSSNLCCSKS